MQAIVLVGGEGTRLRPLTESTPKPALTLVDRPFLAYMIEWLARHGVTEVVLACGFLPDVLREALAGEEERAGVRIRYVVEPEPLGTAGAIRFAADQLGEELEDRFLALNGDVLTDLDLTALLRIHAERSARATIALHPVEDAAPAASPSAIRPRTSPTLRLAPRIGASAVRDARRSRRRRSRCRTTTVSTNGPMSSATSRQADACASVYNPAVALMTTSAPRTRPPTTSGTASLARSPASPSVARHALASPNRSSVAMSAMTSISPPKTGTSAKLSVAARPNMVGKTIVTFAPSSAERYFSSDLFLDLP